MRTSNINTLSTEPLSSAPLQTQTLRLYPRSDMGNPPSNFQSFSTPIIYNNTLIKQPVNNNKIAPKPTPVTNTNNTPVTKKHKNKTVTKTNKLKNSKPNIKHINTNKDNKKQENTKSNSNRILESEKTYQIFLGGIRCTSTRKQYISALKTGQARVCVDGSTAADLLALLPSRIPYGNISVHAVEHTIYLLTKCKVECIAANSKYVLVRNDNNIKSRCNADYLRLTTFTDDVRNSPEIESKYDQTPEYKQVQPDLPETTTTNAVDELEDDINVEQVDAPPRPPPDVHVEPPVPPVPPVNPPPPPQPEPPLPDEDPPPPEGNPLPQPDAADDDSDDENDGSDDEDGVTQPTVLRRKGGMKRTTVSATEPVAKTALGLLQLARENPLNEYAHATQFQGDTSHLKTHVDVSALKDDLIESIDQNGVSTFQHETVPVIDGLIEHNLSQVSLVKSLHSLLDATHSYYKLDD